jgi:hypothetical protein
MNPNEINKAIAEYCGWAEIEPEIERIGIEDVPNGQLRGITPKGNSCVLPDYYNDLNACHEMEKKLNEKKVWEYRNILMSIVYKDLTGPSRGSGAVIHATSAQRCEAFLRTIGKWKE